MTLPKRQGLGDLNQKEKKKNPKEEREEIDTHLPTVWVQTVLCLYQNMYFPFAAQ